MKTAALPTILILASFLSCTGTAQTAQSTLKLEVLSGLPIIDGVYLNGHGPYRFLLDTGEQANEIEPALARKIGLVATMQRDLATPAGVTQVPAAQVKTIALASLQAEGEEFLIAPRPGLRDLSSDIDGTLGQRFLASFDYMLDFKHHRITFAGPAPQGTRIEFQFSYGCMVVPTNVGDLMLDSGASALVFFHAGAHMASASLDTSNANAAVAVGRAPVLRIGDREYHPETAAYRPLAGAPASGLLPPSLFHSIYVSNSGHFVVLDPGEQRLRD